MRGASQNGTTITNGPARRQWRPSSLLCACTSKDTHSILQAIAFALAVYTGLAWRQRGGPVWKPVLWAALFLITTVYDARAGEPFIEWHLALVCVLMAPRASWTFLRPRPKAWLITAGLAACLLADALDGAGLIGLAKDFSRGFMRGGEQGLPSSGEKAPTA